MKRKAKWICVMLLAVMGLPLMASGDGEPFNWKELIAKIVNFAIFFGALGYILKKPVVDFFTGRRAEIETSLSKAESCRLEAARQLEEIEAQSASLGAEVAEILEQAQADAAREKEKLMALAKQEASKIREQASLDIENMRRTAKGDLQAFLAELAVNEAAKIITGTITEKERKQLFTDFSARLEASS